MTRFQTLVTARGILPITLSLLVLMMCALSFSAESKTSNRIKEASARYKREREVYSLLFLFNQLKPGMSRQEVQTLLGKPDYSPIEGQYYYYAENANCSRNFEGPDAPCGVVIEYRSYPDTTVNTTVQSCWFGAIGE